MGGRSGCRPSLCRRRADTVPFAIGRLRKRLQENFEGPEPLGLLGCFVVRRRVVCPPAPQPLTHPANRPWPPPGVPGSSFVGSVSVDPVANIGAYLEPNGFRAVRSQTQQFRLERASAPGLADPSLGRHPAPFFGSAGCCCCAVFTKQCKAMRGRDPRIALKSSIQIKLSRLQTASTML
jgi:hypothetical protein